MNATAVPGQSQRPLPAALETSLNRLSFSGLCATMIGNGIGRFAFIALMPALIQAGLFSQAEAAALGVATLVGYLIGAPVADWLAARWSSAVLLRASMLACCASFLACAVQGAGLPWYFFWRTAAGVAGALLMVLPAPAVLPWHGARVRGRASGIVFSGIGLGAALSGWLVPLLVAGGGRAVVAGDKTSQLLVLRGVAGAWLGMGAVCLVLTALAWRHWRPDAPPASAAAGSSPPGAAACVAADARRSVALILAAHGLNAIGYLAHTMFWVDYAVRELGLPLATGGFLWSLFGLGAALGPLFTGVLADAIGLRRCLIAGFALKAVSAVLPVLSHGLPALIVSSVLMGLLTPGIVALVSAYTLERVGSGHHRRAWGMATTSFALAQAGGGAAMAVAAVALPSYHPLFCVSALALVGSCICIVLIRGSPAAQSPALEFEFVPSPPVTTSGKPPPSAT